MLSPSCIKKSGRCFAAGTFMAPPYVRLPQAPVITTVDRQSFTKQSPFHRVIIEQSLKKSDFAAR
jgi:hypothetical protein